MTILISLQFGHRSIAALNFAFHFWILHAGKLFFQHAFFETATKMFHVSFCLKSRAYPSRKDFVCMADITASTSMPGLF